VNINEKKQTVTEVRERFERSQGFFITHNLGLDAGQISALRKDVRTGGGELKVIKNTLIRRAIEKMDHHADVEKDLKGPVAVAFSYNDPAAIAKAILKYVDDKNKFEVKSGMLGNVLLSSSQVAALAKLPSKQELIARTVRTIAAPLQNFMGVLSAVPRDFMNVLTAIKDKKNN
jgi:large subunit ribosomal protein L10